MIFGMVKSIPPNVFACNICVLVSFQSTADDIKIKLYFHLYADRER